MKEVEYRYCEYCHEWVHEDHECLDEPLRVAKGMMLITPEKVYGLDFEFNRFSSDTARSIAVLKWAIELLQVELVKLSDVSPKTALDSLVELNVQIAANHDSIAGKSDINGFSSFMSNLP